MTSLISRVFSMVMPIFAKYRARGIDFKIAETAEEFEGVHALNYKTFVKELAQYTPTATPRLVDKHHERNLYIIGKKAERVVAMVAITKRGPDGFSVERKLSDPTIIKPYETSGAEIRLLAIDPAYRSSGLFWKLGQELVTQCEKSGFEHFLLSGIEQRVGLYQRIGWEPIAEAAQSGKARFVPMVCSMTRFQKEFKARLGFR